MTYASNRREVFGLIVHHRIPSDSAVKPVLRLRDRLFDSSEDSLRLAIACRTDLLNAGAALPLAQLPVIGTGEHQPGTGVGNGGR
jgi:hypothetical protein